MFSWSGDPVWGPFRRRERSHVVTVRPEVADHVRATATHAMLKLAIEWKVDRQHVARRPPEHQRRPPPAALGQRGELVIIQLRVPDRHFRHAPTDGAASISGEDAERLTAVGHHLVI